MNSYEHPHERKVNHFRSIAGIVLILAGALLFLDRYLRTGWLSLTIIPAVGLFILLWGSRLRHLALLQAGGIIGGVGAGIAAALGSPQPLWSQIGYFCIGFGLGWLAIGVISIGVLRRSDWWALLVAGCLLGAGLSLVFSQRTWIDFILFGAIGVGLPLLVWGLARKMIGLVIPGCLLLGAGPGISLAWGAPAGQANSLAQTGVMLLWFAFGWAFITLSGRLMGKRLLWWPLIPGGILAVVGWGLYIGGNPGNALGFIGNTSAAGMMIFGLYLLLMRKGIHH